VRDIDAVDMRCGYNVKKGEASTAHREQHQEQLFAVGKSLHLRLAVSPIPTNTKPRRSAGVDLMHTVIALAYCDYFLLRNGFVGNCAPYALRRWRS
jgi:hypothetical protein